MSHVAFLLANWHCFVFSITKYIWLIFNILTIILNHKILYIIPLIKVCAIWTINILMINSSYRVRKFIDLYYWFRVGGEATHSTYNIWQTKIPLTIYLSIYLFILLVSSWWWSHPLDIQYLTDQNTPNKKILFDNIPPHLLRRIAFLIALEDTLAKHAINQILLAERICSLSVVIS
jgi:hypothetical protein